MPVRKPTYPKISHLFTRDLLHWYLNNQRDLPWRKTKEPYPVWVSEIILQQTRIDQGLSYYHRFMLNFPDVQALAGATDEEVMKAWQGLGYYTRARNMQEAARQIMSEHKGEFPGTYDRILALRGIGDYTAAAVASISFGLPYPVIDGNVTRFISRYLGITGPAAGIGAKKLIRSFLEARINPVDPGTFNQAVMEFGALVCKPRQPGCEDCIFRGDCLALKSGMVDKIPVPKKAIKKQQRIIHYIVFISEEDGRKFTWMKKRTGKDIWKNLYDFPSLEAPRLMEFDELAGSTAFRELAAGHEPALLDASAVYRHLLTHRELMIRFFTFKTEGFSHSGLLKVSLEDLHRLPFPRIVERFFDHFF